MKCLYCAMPLSKRHEHDHFPIPKAAGGTDTYCVCLNCHDLKDRVPLDNQDATVVLEALMNLWQRAEPVERIMLGRMFRLFAMAGRTREELEYALTDGMFE